MILSLDVSLCTGEIGKTDVNKTNKCVWDMGKHNVFEAVASGGAGDLLFTINLAQQTMFVVFDGLKCDRSRQQGRDDLRPRFCFDILEGHFLVRIG